MTMKRKKKISEMTPKSPTVYALSAAEREPIDGAIALVAATEQQAQGMVKMIIAAHGLKGQWEYDRAGGRLVRMAEAAPATPAGETK